MHTTYLHIITVHIDVLIGIVEDRAGPRVPATEVTFMEAGVTGVPGVAGHVVRHHQDDLAVRDPKPLHAPVD